MRFMLHVWTVSSIGPLKDSALINVETSRMYLLMLLRPPLDTLHHSKTLFVLIWIFQHINLSCDYLHSFKWYCDAVVLCRHHNIWHTHSPTKKNNNCFCPPKQLVVVCVYPALSDLKWGRFHINESMTGQTVGTTGLVWPGALPSLRDQ